MDLKISTFSKTGFKAPESCKEAAELSDNMLIFLRPRDATFHKLKDGMAICVVHKSTEQSAVDNKVANQSASEMSSDGSLAPANASDESPAASASDEKVPSPCFIVSIDRRVPKNTALFFDEPFNNHFREFLSSGERSRVTLHLARRLRPAAKVTFINNFHYSLGPTMAMTVAWLRDSLTLANTLSAHFMCPYLLAHGSVIFNYHQKTLTVTEIVPQPPSPIENLQNMLEPNIKLLYNLILNDDSSDYIIEKNSGGKEEQTENSDDIRYYVTESTVLELLDAANEVVVVQETEERDTSLDFVDERPQLQQLATMFTDHMDLIKQIGCEGRPLNNGVIVHGLYRNYKEELVRTAAAKAGLAVVEHNVSPYIYDMILSTRAVQAMFNAAKKLSPAVIVIPYAECAFEATDNREVVAELLEELQKVQASGSEVIFALISDRLEGVHHSVRAVFRSTLYLPLPTPEQREAFVRQYMGRCYTDPDVAYPWTEEQLQAFVTATESCGFKELTCLLDQKLLEKDVDDPDYGLSGVLREHFKPSALSQSNHSFVPNTTWKDIRGYDTLKDSIKHMVALYRESPKDHSLQGLLLYGPPGCSKTMFAKAFVSETKYSYFSLMCSMILSKYVGQSEKELQRIIQQARDAAPSIVFIDELESLSGSDTGTSLITDLLELVAGCRAHTDGCTNVLFIGATNKPGQLDERLLQSRLFARTVHVGLPDCAARCAMWRHKADTVPWHGRCDVKELCQATEGFSGSEIEGVYHVAGKKKLEEVEAKLSANPEYDPRQDPQPQWVMSQYHITQDRLLQTATNTVPRTPSSLLQDIDKFSKMRQNIMLA